MEEKKIKAVWYASIVIYGITLLYSFWKNMQTEDWHSVGMAFVAMLTPCIVPALFRLFHWKPVYEIYLLSNGFTYFASIWGGSLNAYRFWGYDKLLHFASGWLLCTATALLYFVVKQSCQWKDKREYRIFLIFLNAGNMAAAEIWEFFEYAMLVFFQNDCINHYTQGVHDSMNDMLCATTAGLLMTLCFVRYEKTGKSNFLIRICEKFCERNIRTEF